MKAATFPDGECISALGQGTWNVGDNRSQRAEEIATLQLGLDLGLRLIDTAEMYGDGRSEQLIAEAIAGRRDEAFLVSKVYPHNASHKKLIAACERSLRRLQTDRLDLYLLHWRGDVPLEETLEAFVALKNAGKIRHYGVSNFDVADMRELIDLPGGEAVATNQVLYNLVRRGAERDLQQWCQQHGIPLMAYSPVEQGKLIANHKLVAFAQRHSMTPAQAALGWLLAKDNLIVIPKTSRRERLRENLSALEHPLNADQLAELDLLFPPPAQRRPLDMH